MGNFVFRRLRSANGNKQPAAPYARTGDRVLPLFPGPRTLLNVFLHIDPDNATKVGPDSRSDRRRRDLPVETE
jgi:hypothetical protein